MQPDVTEEYHGSFTGTIISSPYLCTAVGNSPCQILAQLPACNELLYNVELELKERSPGKLCLSSLDYVEPKQESEQQIAQAFNLASCLLSSHHCIASIHIQTGKFFPHYGAMLCSSFSATTPLKRPRFGGIQCLIPTVAPIKKFLTGLEELDCGPITYPNHFIQSLCYLLTKSSVLKKLSLPYWRMTTDEASLFHSALWKNSTLTDLFIDCGCILKSGADYSVEFAAGLAKSTLLKTLAISCHERHRRLGEIKYIVEAVGSSKCITNLCLLDFFIDLEASAIIERLLTSSCILRSFSIEFCVVLHERCEYYPPYLTTDDIDAPSARIRRWITILQKNRSLEQLRLMLGPISAIDGLAFFAELQNNTSLKEVFIEDLQWYFRERILKRGTSLQKDLDISPPDRPDILITQCKTLTNVNLAFLLEQDVTWMEMALGALKSSSHVTKLTLDIHRAHPGDMLEEQIADYIKHTNTLKEVELSLPLHPDNVTTLACRIQTIEALKDNSSLKKLIIRTDAFTDEEAILFATMLRSSKKIYDLQIYSSTESTERLVNCLSPGFSRSYTLVSLQCYGIDAIPLTRNYYIVMDVVRRNHDLVTRAADCATVNRNRGCIEALELVAENPALIEKICELQSLGENEAVEILRNALGPLPDLDYYMRVTGVVKSRVSCQSGGDVKLQLNDLDEYSWRSVRRLLRVSDVLPGTTSCVGT